MPIHSAIERSVDAGMGWGGRGWAKSLRQQSATGRLPTCARGWSGLRTEPSRPGGKAQHLRWAPAGARALPQIENRRALPSGGSGGGGPQLDREVLDEDAGVVQVDQHRRRRPPGPSPRTRGGARARHHLARGMPRSSFTYDAQPGDPAHPAHRPVGRGSASPLVTRTSCGRTMARTLEPSGIALGDAPATACRPRPCPPSPAPCSTLAVPTNEATNERLGLVVDLARGVPTWCTRPLSITTIWSDSSSASS